MEIWRYRLDIDNIDINVERYIEIDYIDIDRYGYIYYID